MGKRKKKKKRSYLARQAFYEKLFEESTTKPGQVRDIAVQVFGSTYFTVENQHKH